MLLREEKDFFIIWITSIFTFIFERAFIFIIPVYIFDLTSDKQLVGLGSVFEIITILMFGILGGYIIDSFNSKNVLITSNVMLLFISILGFFIYLYFSSLSVFLIMIVFTVGISRTNNLARTSIIFHTFTGEKLKLANALFGLLFSTSIIVGPIIGSSIYTYKNINGVFLLGAAVAFISIIMFAKLKEGAKLKKPVPFFKGMLDTYNTIVKNKYLLGVLGFQVLLFGTTAVEGTLFYVFTKEVVKQDTAFFTLVVIVQGVGQLLGSAFFTKLTKNRATNSVVFLFTLIISILEGLYILFPSYYLILLSSLIVGVCFQIIIILSNTVFMQLCTSDDVGRLNGFKNTITSSSSIIFIAIFSYLLSYFSITTILLMNIIIMGIGSFLALKYVVEQRTEQSEKLFTMAK